LRMIRITVTTGNRAVGTLSLSGSTRREAYVCDITV
jgi:hypothetical protein